MIHNFIRTAFRHLIKNKAYAFLNIFGLSVGLACFTLIAVWVSNELSYDRFHEKSDRIFRIAGTFTDESGQFDQAVTCIPLAPALANDLPEVEEALRIDKNDAIVQLGDKQFVEDDILAVDPAFFNFFDFKILKGQGASALKEPYSIMLSESMAKKYFGDKDPIGESLKVFLHDPGSRGIDYKITGVVEDCPDNSHFKYNFLFSFSTMQVTQASAFGYDGWFNNGYYTYVLLKQGTKTDHLKSKLSTFLEKYIGKDMKKNKVYWSYFLQPLTDIHLKSHLRYEIGPTSNVTYLLIFGSVGFIVLLLACINYVNLSTAYAGTRFKEVGVRKVMGAHKAQLITQYLVESWLLAMLSLLLAVVWIELVRPLFESLTGKVINNLYALQTIVLLVSITSLVGLLSGLYPSVVLSSFKTVNVLKGQFATGTSGVWLRKSLVVLQYSITMVLITSILVIQLQFRFISNKDLGFNEDNLLILNVNGSGEVRAGFDAFSNELLSDPAVTGIARSKSMLAGGLGNTIATLVDASGKKVNGTLYMNGIDDAFIDTYQMKLAAGRNFTEGKADSLGIIVNEATTRAYGYQHPQDAVGTEIYFGETRCEIIGIVKDFHYSSLQQKIEPTALYLYQDGYSRIAVRLSGDPHRGLTTVMHAWKKHFPNSIPQFSFAEERLEKQYQTEQRFSKIFLIFSVISMAIACLGLFALVSYSVESRTKEIGIRKVLGASVTEIVNMLSKEFIVLILVSCALAIPVAWYFMQQWLQDFAYHVTVGVEVFAIAGSIALSIAIVTIGLKAIRSAMHNPVDSLRNE